VACPVHYLYGAKYLTPQVVHPRLAQQKKCTAINRLSKSWVCLFINVAAADEAQRQAEP
jgi:hypothetical protein